MKIIFCKGRFMGPISGADETLVTYATQLRMAGHDVSVLLMYPHAPDDPYYRRLVQAGVCVSYLASSSVGTSINTGRSLALGISRLIPSSKKLLRRNAQNIASSMAARYYAQCRDYLEQSKADLIHVVTPDPSATVMIRVAHDCRIPVIYQELGTPYHPLEFKTYYEQFTAVLPFCSKVAALSPFLAQLCREQLPYKASLSVLPIMVVGPEAKLNSHDNSRNGDVTFGFASRIEPLKGPAFLVEAFSMIYQKNKNVRLKIAGAGSQQQKVASRAERLGCADGCHFAGVYTWPDEKRAFMQSVDIFILPSQTEGTPNCIVEAMSHGLPVIASDVGGIPDVVTPETGILVPAGDIAALASAMNHLAKDKELRARMGRAAKERYEKLFSPGAVLPVLLDTYSGVAGKNGANPLNKNGNSHPWTGQVS